MDSRLKFRPRLAVVEPRRDTGTKRERLCGWPSNARRAQARDLMREGAGQPKPSRRGVDRQEKLCGELQRCPYRKPTQVGEASSLR